VPLSDETKARQQRDNDNAAADDPVRQRFAELLNHQITEQENPAE
jgi:hypothetical protein